MPRGGERFTENLANVRMLHGLCLLLLGFMLEELWRRVRDRLPRLLVSLHSGIDERSCSAIRRRRLEFLRLSFEPEIDDRLVVKEPASIMEKVHEALSAPVSALRYRNAFNVFVYSLGAPDSLATFTFSDPFFPVRRYSLP